MANPKSRRNADCHPDRAHVARGLCEACYARQWRRGRHVVQNQARQRAWRQANPDKTRKYQRDFEYGKHDWSEMLASQGGRCAICCGPGPLAVDHDHEKGHVRGLLCRKCNTGIGMLRDDPVLLRRGYHYLLARSPV